MKFWLVFFFDRSADYITPMCTAYTYESMLHNTFGINFNFCIVV